MPTWRHYDVLRGLDYLRSTGAASDERVAEAIDLVASKRQGDDRWVLETRYPGVMPVETDEEAGPAQPMDHPARPASTEMVLRGKLMPAPAHYPRFPLTRWPPPRQWTISRTMARAT